MITDAVLLVFTTPLLFLTTPQIKMELNDGDEKVALRETIGFYEQYNGTARALYILVHFFAILCKTTT